VKCQIVIPTGNVVRGFACAMQDLQDVIAIKWTAWILCAPSTAFVRVVVASVDQGGTVTIAVTWTIAWCSACPIVRGMALLIWTSDSVCAKSIGLGRIAPKHFATQIVVPLANASGNIATVWTVGLAQNVITNCAILGVRFMASATTERVFACKDGMDDIVH